jgi:pSer/pThr/pTyr-binding forkhead associated (FHA) protein
MRPAGRPKAILLDNTSGEKLVINMYETSIGRAKSSDIIVDSAMISRSHAVISRRKKGWFISDTNSKVGTFVNGEPAVKRTRIYDGDTITVANREYTFIAPNAVRDSDDNSHHDVANTVAHKESLKCSLTDNATGEVYPISNYVLDIGRSASNDIVIDDPRVSRYHASVKHTGEGWFVVDKDSTAGTGLNGYRVNDKEALSDGDVIQVLSHRFTFSEHKGGGR